jgi:hypothetical protein
VRPHTHRNRRELLYSLVGVRYREFYLEVLIPFTSFLYILDLIPGMLYSVERRLKVVVRLVSLIVRARLYLRVVVLIPLRAGGPRRA